MTAEPVAVLARPLTRAKRDLVAGHVRALIGWQRTLRRWPVLTGAPDATPFVSLYADGALRGCFGSHEGGPNERLARAFLRALEDCRYGLVRPEERGRLAVVVSYVRSLWGIDPRRVEREIEAGRDGLAVVPPRGPPVVLLPHVARDLRVGPIALLERLAAKARLTDWTHCTLFGLRTEDVVVRPGTRGAPTSKGDARRVGAGWLERLVGRDGSIAFAIDARKRARISTGRMHHGRAAVVVRALGEHREFGAVTRRARRWLAGELASGLRGNAVEGWPTEPAMLAGTLALACMAGIDVLRELSEMAASDALRASPWHGAQVLAALGREAPASLWEACVADLSVRPFAPWTAIAARVRGDGEIRQRASRALCASIRSAAPHRGGCDVTRVPETALTALVVEALEGAADAEALAAVREARTFLAAAQLLGEAIPAPLDPELSHGGFAASPICVDYLRCDVAGHALLAMKG